MSRIISIDEALHEVCKYITQMSSFFDVPASALPAAIKTIRGRRMVDRLGEFRSLRSSGPGSPRSTYLDTHGTSDGMRIHGGRRVLPHRRAKSSRRPRLRKIGAEMIAQGKRPEWLLYLHRRIRRTQDFRRTQLAENHPHATFFTLSGQVWHGRIAGESVLEAPACVSLFASVGVTAFSVTLLKDSNPIGKRGMYYEPRLSMRQLCRNLPNYIRRNRTKPESLIICPIGDHLIQVDDCVGASLERIRSFAFLVNKTSEGNYQAYLALPQGTSKPEQSNIRLRLLSQLPGVDRSASGPMRWPGSINHKPERNEFLVRLVDSRPGRFVTVAELEEAGLLSPLHDAAETVIEPKQFIPAGIDSRSSFPDYERCLKEAPCKHDGSPDRSIADKNWAILALDRGILPTKVEAKLRELSDKANRRPDYARRTVAYALLVVSRGRAKNVA